MSAFREIRGVRQRGPHDRRRWFQSPFFDLFFRQDAEGVVQWFQLCYARDTWRAPRAALPSGPRGDAEVARAPALP